MAKIISLSDDFFAEGGFKPKALLKPEKEELCRDTSIVKGFLNGLLADDIARLLEVDVKHLRVLSSRVRQILCVPEKNQRGLIAVAFERGLKAVITQEDISNFDALHDDEELALDMIAAGFANKDLGDKFNKSPNYVSKFVTACSDAMIPVGTKRQSLLPAVAFRAVDIHKARLDGNHNYFPNVNVAMDNNGVALG